MSRFLKEKKSWAGRIGQIYRRAEWRIPRWLLGIFGGIAFLSMNAFLFQYEAFSILVAPLSVHPDGMVDGFWKSLSALMPWKWSTKAWGHLGAATLPAFIFGFMVLPGVPFEW